MSERGPRPRTLRVWCRNQDCWDEQTRVEWRVIDCPNDGTHITCPRCGDPVRARLWSDLVWVNCQHCGKPLEGQQSKWCSQDCFILGNRSITWFYPQLRDQQAGLCGICLLPLRRHQLLYRRNDGRLVYASDASGHVDHIVPRDRGGADALENFAAAHERCNLRKSTKTLEEARAHIGMTDELVAERLLFMALPPAERDRLRGGPLPEPEPAEPEPQQALFDACTRP